MVIADRVRTTGKKSTRKNGHIEAKCVLVQKPVFCGKLYVADPGTSATGDRLIKAGGQGRCELKVGSRAVIEIYSGLSSGAIARIRSGVECIYFELTIRGRLRVVGYERWPRDRWPRQHEQH